MKCPECKSDTVQAQVSLCFHDAMAGGDEWAEHPVLSEVCTNTDCGHLVFHLAKPKEFLEWLSVENTANR